MRLGRLYSICSTKDNIVDKKELLLHTLTEMIETLGLGIILFIAKILIPTISENFDHNQPESTCVLNNLRTHFPPAHKAILLKENQ